MDLKETTSKVQNFINTLRYQSFSSKLEFLRFNSYHHRRPMREVLQIYVQNPEARLLGSFNFWKNLSEESSVEFGQKSSVRLYDDRGNTTDILYDLAQTTLKHDANLELLPFRVEMSSELLFNTLAYIADDSFTLDDYTSEQYFEESLAKINKFVEPHRAGLSKFTDEEIDVALNITRYNLFEEFGVYLSEEIEYSSIETAVTNDISKFSHDRFLPVYSLANNISQALTSRVQENYKEVQVQLDEIKENQKNLNDQLEGLAVDIDFSTPSSEPLDTELTQEVETTESTVQIEEDSLSEAEIELIREREITRVLKRGSGVEHGKFRIAYGYSSTLSKTERANLLKDEYGLGGHASPDDYYMSLFDAKGIELSSRTLNDEILYSWSEIADRVDLLINSNEYFSNDEVKGYEEWLEQISTPDVEEEIQELDPLDDFTTMLMDGEDERTVKVDGTDTYTFKITDSEDGKQITFEMYHEETSERKYLKYENNGFISNTFDDEFTDYGLNNPILLEQLQFRLEENNARKQNQSTEIEDTQEISL